MINYSTDQSQEVYKQNRALKYARQKHSARIAQAFTGHKVSTCMHTATGKIEVKFSQEKRRAFYSGLATCGSVWDCPICSAKISARRAEDINLGVDNWMDRGGSIVMVTYTLRHDINDRLDVLSRVLTDATRFVHSGAPYARLKERIGIKGSITATEILYNRDNGWHIHKHQVLFLDNNQVNIEDLQRWIYARYESYLESKGFDSLPDVGVKVSEICSERSQLPGYITKWGIENELTALDKKVSKGMTPFEMLDYQDLDSEFAEYSLAMYGKRRLVWSKGLRSLLGLGSELTDQQLAEVEDYLTADVVTLKEIPVHEWHYIRAHDLKCQVLENAERGEIEFFYWYLDNVIYKLDPGSGCVI